MRWVLAYLNILCNLTENRPHSLTGHTATVISHLETESTMSGSIHTTYKKNIRGLTNKELVEQFNDPNSDLAALAKKSGMKRQVRKNRKQSRVSKKNAGTDL